MMEQYEHDLHSGIANNTTQHALPANLTCCSIVEYTNALVNNTLTILTIINVFVPEIVMGIIG